MANTGSQWMVLFAYISFALGGVLVIGGCIYVILWAFCNKCCSKKSKKKQDVQEVGHAKYMDHALSGTSTAPAQDQDNESLSYEGHTFLPMDGESGEGTKKHRTKETKVHIENEQQPPTTGRSLIEPDGSSFHEEHDDKANLIKDDESVGDRHRSRDVLLGAAGGATGAAVLAGATSMLVSGKEDDDREDRRHSDTVEEQYASSSQHLNDETAYVNQEQRMSREGSGLDNVAYEENQFDTDSRTSLLNHGDSHNVVAPVVMNEFNEERAEEAFDEEGQHFSADQQAQALQESMGDGQSDTMENREREYSEQAHDLEERRHSSHSQNSDFPSSTGAVLMTSDRNMQEDYNERTSMARDSQIEKNESVSVHSSDRVRSQPVVFDDVYDENRRSLTEAGLGDGSSIQEGFAVEEVMYHQGTEQDGEDGFVDCVARNSEDELDDYGEPSAYEPEHVEVTESNFVQEANLLDRTNANLEEFPENDQRLLQELQEIDQKDEVTNVFQDEQGIDEHGISDEGETGKAIYSDTDENDSDNDGKLLAAVALGGPIVGQKIRKKRKGRTPLFGSPEKTEKEVEDKDKQVESVEMSDVDRPAAIVTSAKETKKEKKLREQEEKRIKKEKERELKESKRKSKKKKEEKDDDDDDDDMVVGGTAIASKKESKKEKKEKKSKKEKDSKKKSKKKEKGSNDYAESDKDQGTKDEDKSRFAEEDSSVVATNVPIVAASMEQEQSQNEEEKEIKSKDSKKKKKKSLFGFGKSKHTSSDEDDSYFQSAAIPLAGTVGLGAVTTAVIASKSENEDVLMEKETEYNEMQNENENAFLVQPDIDTGRLRSAPGELEDLSNIEEPNEISSQQATEYVEKQVEEETGIDEHAIVPITALSKGSKKEKKEKKSKKEKDSKKKKKSKKEEEEGKQDTSVLSSGEEYLDGEDNENQTEMNEPKATGSKKEKKKSWFGFGKSKRTSTNDEEPNVLAAVAPVAGATALGAVTTAVIASNDDDEREHKEEIEDVAEHESMSTEIEKENTFVVQQEENNDYAVENERQYTEMAEDNAVMVHQDEDVERFRSVREIENENAFVVQQEENNDYAVENERHYTEMAEENDVMVHQDEDVERFRSVQDEIEATGASAEPTDMFEEKANEEIIHKQEEFGEEDLQVSAVAVPTIAASRDSEIDEIQTEMNDEKNERDSKKEKKKSWFGFGKSKRSSSNEEESNILTTVAPVAGATALGAVTAAVIASNDDEEHEYKETIEDVVKHEGISTETDQENTFVVQQEEDAERFRSVQEDVQYSADNEETDQPQDRGAEEIDYEERTSDQENTEVMATAIPIIATSKDSKKEKKEKKSKKEKDSKKKSKKDSKKKKTDEGEEQESKIGYTASPSGEEYQNEEEELNKKDSKKEKKKSWFGFGKSKRTSSKEEESNTLATVAPVAGTTALGAATAAFIASNDDDDKHEYKEKIEDVVEHAAMSTEIENKDAFVVQQEEDMERFRSVQDAVIASNDYDDDEQEYKEKIEDVVEHADLSTEIENTDTFVVQQEEDTERFRSVQAAAIASNDYDDDEHEYKEKIEDVVEHADLSNEIENTDTFVVQQEEDTERFRSVQEDVQYSAANEEMDQPQDKETEEIEYEQRTSDQENTFVVQQEEDAERFRSVQEDVQYSATNEETNQPQDRGVEEIEYEERTSDQENTEVMATAIPIIATSKDSKKEKKEKKSKKEKDSKKKSKKDSKKKKTDEVGEQESKIVNPTLSSGEEYQNEEEELNKKDSKKEKRKSWFGFRKSKRSSTKEDDNNVLATVAPVAGATALGAVTAAVVASDDRKEDEDERNEERSSYYEQQNAVNEEQFEESTQHAVNGMQYEEAAVIHDELETDRLRSTQSEMENSEIINEPTTSIANAVKEGDSDSLIIADSPGPRARSSPILYEEDEYQDSSFGATGGTADKKDIMTRDDEGYQTYDQDGDSSARDGHVDRDSSAEQRELIEDEQFGEYSHGDNIEQEIVENRKSGTEFGQMEDDQYNAIPSVVAVGGMSGFEEKRNSKRYSGEETERYESGDRHSYRNSEHDQELSDTQQGYVENRNDERSEYEDNWEGHAVQKENVEPVMAASEGGLTHELGQYHQEGVSDGEEDFSVSKAILADIREKRGLKSPTPIDAKNGDDDGTLFDELHNVLRSKKKDERESGEISYDVDDGKYREKLIKANEHLTEEYNISEVSVKARASMFEKITQETGENVKPPSFGNVFVAQSYLGKSGPSSTVGRSDSKCSDVISEPDEWAPKKTSGPSVPPEHLELEKIATAARSNFKQSAIAQAEQIPDKESDEEDNRSVKGSLSNGGLQALDRNDDSYDEPVDAIKPSNRQSGEYKGSDYTSYDHAERQSHHSGSRTSLHSGKMNDQGHPSTSNGVHTDQNHYMTNGHHEALTDEDEGHHSTEYPEDFPDDGNYEADSAGHMMDLRKTKELSLHENLAENVEDRLVF